MPRGEHFKMVEDEEILEQFDRDDLGRSLFTPDELAEDLPVGGEAVRQRLHKMKGDEVETEQLGGATLWKLKGEQVFASGLFAHQEYFFPKLSGSRVRYGLIGAVLYTVLFTVLAVLDGNVFAPPYSTLLIATAFLAGSAVTYIAIYAASFLIGVLAHYGIE